MSSNSDRLLAILKEQADLIDKLNTRSDFQYKSTQRLVLDYGKPFVTQVKSLFKGERKACFENCYKALWDYSQLSYCEGFAIDDELDFAVPHAWLVNNAMEVIDPTWIGNKFKGSTYFGIVFNRQFVMEMVEKTRSYGILDSDYMNEHQLKREGFSPHALHPVFHSSVSVPE
ncbi:hypothetical protein ANSO36C_67920 (plasmid) [Nostoc cf. commune SO-36]|uniref:Uncharacterized protein n=1 Tax=Nostoc cf. commune SO-36 TaxID=449208 RepID=A0ABM7ZCG4_NOSCO|nr:hypothetical protein [Nostoc commune]BDI20990.1 hypothetical protein ANSO36C_67920 [Nostoc cf. commune SO-36]